MAIPGTDRVMLRWDAAPDATGYEVEWKEGNGQWESSYTGSNTQATISGLTPDTEYTFRVAATNAQGTSGWAYLTKQTKIQEDFIRIIRLTKAAVCSPESEGYITVG